MELDNRKNEARADLKRQDITVEVVFFIHIYFTTNGSVGIAQQEHRYSRGSEDGNGKSKVGQYATGSL